MIKDETRKQAGPLPLNLYKEAFRAVIRIGFEPMTFSLED
jgi:hypothetical protein